MSDLAAIDWILKNKEWVFSGVGIVAISVSVKVLFSLLSKNNLQLEQQPINIDASNSTGNVNVILNSSNSSANSEISKDIPNSQLLVKKEKEYGELLQKKESIDVEITKLLESHHNLTEITNDAKSQILSEYSDISDWLINSIDIISDRLFNFVINHKSINKGVFFKTLQDLETFKEQIKQIIEIIEISILSNNYELIDEPSKYIKYGKLGYILALKELNKTLPVSLSKKSKKEFIKYTKYIISRIDLGS